MYILHRTRIKEIQYQYTPLQYTLLIDQYISYREYYMALSVSHPVSTRDTNIIPRALANMQISFVQY